jgi:hypothetical protein
MGEGLGKVLGWAKKMTPVMTIVMLCLIRTRPIPDPLFLLAVKYLLLGSFSALKMETVSSSET